MSICQCRAALCVNSCPYVSVGLLFVQTHIHMSVQGCSLFQLMSVCQCRAALCSNSCFVCQCRAALCSNSCLHVSAGLCQGRGALLTDPGQVQQLESDLAHLAPRLSSLAVLLRATVLPAMSLVNPEVASRLQVHPHSLGSMVRS